MSKAPSHCVLQSLAVNRRIQSQNNAPREFPLFVREGYKVKVLADDYVMDKGGLIYKASPSMHAQLTHTSAIVKACLFAGL